MARSSQPVRLTADPSTSQALRALVDHARNDIPEASALARFGMRLDTAIAANMPGPKVDLSPPTLTSGLTGGKALGLALGLVIGGVVAGGIWFGSRNHGSSPLQTSATVPSVALPTSVPSSSLPEVPASSVTSEIPSEQKRGASREAANEAALLHSARSALTRDPGRALRLTKEHARRFPRGDLTQEREVIAIEALRRLGQTDAAQQRGTAFEQKYPGSVHQSKIEQTLKGKLR